MKARSALSPESISFLTETDSQRAGGPKSFECLYGARAQNSSPGRQICDKMAWLTSNKKGVVGGGKLAREREGTASGRVPFANDDGGTERYVMWADLLCYSELYSTEREKTRATSSVRTKMSLAYILIFG